MKLDDDPGWDTDDLPSHKRRDRTTTWTVAAALALVMITILTTLHH